MTHCTQQSRTVDTPLNCELLILCPRFLLLIGLWLICPPTVGADISAIWILVAVTHFTLWLHHILGIQYLAYRN